MKKYLLFLGVALLSVANSFGQCALNVLLDQSQFVCEGTPFITVQNTLSDYTYDLLDEEGFSISFIEGNGFDQSFFIEVPLNTSANLTVVAYNEDLQQCNQQVIPISIVPIADANISETNFSISSGEDVTITVEQTQVGIDYEVYDSQDNFISTINGDGNDQDIIIPNILESENYYIQALLFGAENQACLLGIRLSDEVSVIVNTGGGGEPEITFGPTDNAICPGNDAFFFVETSEEPISYSWEVSSNQGANWTMLNDNQNYNGTSSSALTVSGIDASFHNNLYRVRVSFDFETLISDAAKLIIAQKPIANISAPNGLKGCDGNLPELIANTNIGVYYQWFLNGSELEVYTANITPEIAGSYSVLVSTDTCSTLSAEVSVQLISSQDFSINPSTNVQPCTDNETFNFGITGSYINDLSSIQWQRNQSNISGATSLNQSFSQPGSYRAVLQAYGGCSYTTPSTSILTPKINIVSLSPLNTTVDEGNSVTVQLSSSKTGISYTLLKENPETLVDGPKVGTGTSITLNTGAVNEFSIFKVRATDNAGCTVTMPETVRVDINGSSTTIVTQPQNAASCLGGSASFSIEISGPSTGFQWQESINGGGNWSNLSDNSIYSGTQSKTLSLSSLSFDYDNRLYRAIVLADPNNLTSQTAELSIVAPPSPSVFLPNGTRGCAEIGIAIGTGSDAGLSFQWLINGELISGANQATFTAMESGFYQVRVSNTTGCTTTTDSIALTIVTNEDFSFSPKGTIPKCEPADEVLLSVNSVYIDDVSRTNWYLNDEIVPNKIQTSERFSQAGVYTARTEAYNGCIFSLSDTAILENRALSEIEFEGNPNTTYCFGDPVNLSLANTDVGVNYYLINSATGNIAYGPKQGNGAALSFTFSAHPDTASIGIRAESQSGSCSKNMTAELLLSISEAPINLDLEISGNDTLCEGGLTSTLNSLEPATSSFQWYVNNNPIQNATNRSLEVSNPGIYYVEINNGFCLKSSENQNISEINLDDLLSNSTAEIAKPEFCENEEISISLTQLPVGVELYLFDIGQQRVVGESITSSSSEATLNIRLKTSTSLSVVAKLGPCQSVITILPITIIPSPSENLPSLNTDIFSCAGEANTVIANTFDSFSYQFFDIQNEPITEKLTGTGNLSSNIGGSLNFTFNTNSGTKMMLRTTDNNGNSTCAANSDTIEIKDGGNGGKSILNNFLIASKGCVNDTFRIFEQFEEGAIPSRIEWKFGDGTESNEINPTKIYRTAGIFNVSCTVFTENCPSTSLNKPVEIENCLNNTKALYDNPYIQTLEVYPNPSFAVFSLNLEMVEDMDLQLQIIGLEGITWLSHFYPSVRTINTTITDLKPGIYILLVRTAHFSETRRIQIL